MPSEATLYVCKACKVVHWAYDGGEVSRCGSCHHPFLREAAPEDLFDAA